MPTPIISSTRKQSLMRLLSAYEGIKGVHPKQLAILQKVVGARWIDLLFYLPTNVVDRRHICTLATATEDTPATVQVTVDKHHKPYHRRQPYRISVHDDSGSAVLIFFNHGRWLERAFPEGEGVILHGKVSQTLEGPQLAHPMVWPAKKDVADVARLWPVYGLGKGLSQATVATAMKAALEQLKNVQLPEWLPEDVAQKTGWSCFAKAILAAHTPEKAEDILAASAARCRLAFDELLAGQLALLKARAATRQKPGIAHQAHGEKTERFLSRLPFELTKDQQAAWQDIQQDMQSVAPMLRLVQGDVGSGKTVVAFLALLQTVESGRQGALLAPTEILAQQHFQAAKKWLEPLGIRVAILSGTLTAAEKRQLKKELKGGAVDVVIGTHALVQKSVVIPNLGLAVVDEQHRFGVTQRLNLGVQGEEVPDMLIMTATPIPRSLALTYYGDMEVSSIREKPAGRPPVTTVAKPVEKLDDVALAIKRKLAKNEQVFWVCPLVEGNEESDRTAATERFEHLRRIYGEAVALLHGKMKGEEKDEVLRRFRDGETKILVSTTVIEVGIDVPQATLIVIEHAERFGLAQLHQLRGRVGRGGEQYGAASCVLLYRSPLSDYAHARVDALRETNDGFLLAEKDLELRGPGEVLGTRQAGQVQSKLVDFAAHKDLIPLARAAALEALANPQTPQAKAAEWLLDAFEKREGAALLKAG